LERLFGEIDKGGVRGLELLGLVGKWPVGEGRKCKTGNVKEIKAAFCKLYRFLDAKLSKTQKRDMVFDMFMTENGLCKVLRVVKAQKFKI
jgi:hypothetical protein